MNDKPHFSYILLRIVQMDALSHALSAIRLSSPLIAQVRLGENAALQLESGPSSEHHCPFHYVVSGSCRLSSGDSERELVSGDLVLLPRWPYYQITSGSGATKAHILDLIQQRKLPMWSVTEGLDASLAIDLGDPPFAATLLSGIFAFQDAPARLLLKDLPELIHFSAEGHEMHGLLRAALDFIRAGDTPKPGFAAVSSRLLELVLVEALRTWAIVADHGPGRLKGLTDKAIAPVLLALHANPGRAWRVADMARIAGRSRSGFIARFNTVVGVAPSTYLSEWRYQLAARALVETAQPVGQLASKLGYSDTYAFSRAFRGWSGTTPARFRREHIKRR